MTEPIRAPAPSVSFDGGNLDCGNGLLLLIRRHIDPLRPGELLEIRSREASVEEDLPAWCRMTRNDLVACERGQGVWTYLVCKGAFRPAADPGPPAADSPAGAGPVHPAPAADRRRQMPAPFAIRQPAPARPLAAVAPALAVPPLAVMGVGSWPRPRWMLEAVHARLSGQLPEEEFQQTADDAVRLAAAAQVRAGVDVITDGEQRRDNYASFVGAILDNCQLIPITDLLPYVDDPDEFARELAALDVPAEKVRHPAVFGALGRSRPLAVQEARFLRSITDKPIKVALPGPYLLTRTMWMECISDRAYDKREDLAADVVRVLREELFDLLADGVSLIQFDEPVLTEVVFSPARRARTFMCGALGEKRDPAVELPFALSLLQQVVAGAPVERTALHICRGNWSPDESLALRGGYEPLMPYLRDVPVGTLMLELCTPRAGELEALRHLPEHLRIGVGVVNQKHATVESVASITASAERAIALFGAGRVLLNPDCGFATFADNPLQSAPLAEAKLRAITEAAAGLRRKYRIEV